MAHCGSTSTPPAPASWISTDDGEVWSDSTNWDGALVASGSGATADFSLRDLTADTSLVLDSNRTLGRLVFGDTDYSTPPSWTISDGGVTARILTLSANPTIQVDAATSPAGDTTDVPAAAAYPHHLAASLVGSTAWTKTGVGTIEFNRPNPSLTGALTRTDGFIKTGGGTLTLSDANTFASSVTIDAGTLNLTGSLSNGGAILVNTGATLAGTGTISRAVTLNPGGASAGTLAAASLTWNGGGRLVANLGSATDRLALVGALTKGSAGPFVFHFTPSNLVVGTSYTLATFASTGFAVSDFCYTGLGDAKGHFTLTGTSLQFTLDDGVAVAPLLDWMTTQGLAANPADTLLDPDGDGVPTLLEFVLGSTPGENDRAAITTKTVSAGASIYPTIRYPRRRARGGVAVMVQIADNLAFTSPIPALEISAAPRGDGIDEVVARSTVPMSVTPRQFLRVVATLP